jgi:uncharacterized cupredoxin-like copper-binding protein
MLRVRAVSILALVALAGCGGGGSGASAVRLTDFAIAVSGMKAGHVSLSVRNAGQSAHDVVVLRTDLAPDAIPAPGGTADATAAGVQNLGGTNPLVPGTKAKLSVDLTPGKYVFVCTLPGHYGQGMHVGVTVP